MGRINKISKPSWRIAFGSTMVISLFIAIYFIGGDIFKRKNGELQGNQEASCSTISLLGQQIPEFRLKDLDRNLIIDDRYLKERNLFVFFSPFDCSNCLGESKYWQMLYDRNLSNITVFGVVRNKDMNYLDRFRNSYYLTFPILIDADEVLFSKLSISQTPLKLVIDKSKSILKVDQSILKSYRDLYEFLCF